MGWSRTAPGSKSFRLCHHLKLWTELKSEWKQKTKSTFAEEPSFDFFLFVIGFKFRSKPISCDKDWPKTNSDQIQIFQEISKFFGWKVQVLTLWDIVIFNIPGCLILCFGTFSRSKSSTILCQMRHTNDVKIFDLVVS